jgi:predicted MarR family transcription regulator
MALVGALCITLNAVTGFTNRSLRAQVAGLLGDAYRPSQMTYDLRRLRRKGLIQRRERSHSYSLTPDGVRVAIFYTKLHRRLLRPLVTGTILHNHSTYVPHSTSSITTSPIPLIVPVSKLRHEI